MSSFGEYVHVYWKNYKEYGASRSNPQKKTKNFSLSIFQEHRDKVQAQIDAIRFNPAELKNLEIEYNDQIQKEYDALKKLENTLIAGSKLNGLQQLIANLLGDINSNWSSSAQQIAADLYYDASTQSFKYKPSKNQSAVSYNVKGKFPQTPWKERFNPNAISSSGALTGYHYGSTVVKYGEEVIAVLQTAYADNSLQEQHTIRVLIEGIRALDKARKTNGNNLKEQSYQYKIHNVKEQIDKIKTQFTSIDEVERQINAAFAEMLGNLIAQRALGVGSKSLEDCLRGALQVGRTQTIHSGMPKIVQLSFKDAAVEFATQGEKASMFKTAGQSKYTDGSDAIFWEYAIKELGQARDQKSDVEVMLKGKMHGLSVKNIDLNKTYYKDKEGNLSEYRIGVQDSSLLLYLLGIEQSQSKMGTHYLNVLAKHEEDDDSLEEYTEARKEADEALSLYILYSALTGRGQLRTTQTPTGFANIFAVHDKSKIGNTGVHRVRFYDMGAIIDDVMKNDMNAINPSISSIELYNTKASGDGDPMAPMRRITQLLIDARKKTVAINLSHLRLSQLNKGIIT